MARSDFIPMDCPICDSYYFTEDQEDIQNDYCRHCGWKYDLRKVKDPDFKNGDEMSLNEYKAWFQLQVAKNPEYDFSDATYKETPHKCPICEKYTFPDISSFYICPYCGWEDDNLMESKPNDYAGCANDLCLNDFKKRYLELIRKNPKYHYKKDGFGDETK